MLSNKSLLLTAVLAFGLTSEVLSSRAYANEFNFPGAACVPGDNAIYGNRYFTTASGSVRQSGAYPIANADFYCPIPQNISAPSHVYLLYSSTENDPSTYVTASYVKMNKTTGAITTVATASSRNGTNNGSITWREQPFTATYDPANYTYYVRVDMQRRNTSQAVEFFQVTVW